MAKMTLSIRSAIGAATTIANILSGTDIEWLSFATAMTILANGDIAGMTLSLRYTPPSGVPQNPIPTSAINAASTVGNVKADEDLLAPQLAIPAGSRLIVAVVNPGAASNFTTRFILE